MLFQWNGLKGLGNTQLGVSVVGQWSVKNGQILRVNSRDGPYIKKYDKTIEGSGFQAWYMLPYQGIRKDPEIFLRIRLLALLMQFSLFFIPLYFAEYI